MTSIGLPRSRIKSERCLKQIPRSFAVYLGQNDESGVKFGVGQPVVESLWHSG
jgi:hypothetical protein